MLFVFFQIFESDYLRLTLLRFAYILGGTKKIITQNYKEQL